MNIPTIKLAGMRLSLEAEVGAQKRLLEQDFKDANYESARLRAKDIVELLTELIQINKQNREIQNAIKSVPPTPPNPEKCKCGATGTRTQFYTHMKWFKDLTKHGEVPCYTDQQVNYSKQEQELKRHDDLINSI